ncbi:MAG TPA: DUF2806 domain-containing protein [Methylococcaceae bacterium]|nr:DUF2806 domain-containing protein [Methylococcaceae bacterium]
MEPPENPGGELPKPARKLLETVTQAIGPLPLSLGVPSAEEWVDSTLAAAPIGVVGRARRRVEGREILRQANCEAIVVLALAELPAEVSDEAVEPGWVVRFFGLAQDVARPEFQHIWARLLAAEVANPQSSSTRTLHTLGMMDAWEVEGFEAYCAFSFAFESGGRFMIADDAARTEMRGYLSGDDLTQHFIDSGLLSAELEQRRVLPARGLRIGYAAKRYQLAKPQPEFEERFFCYRPFTRAGQQLASALRAKTFYGYARNVFRVLQVERGISFQEITDGQ